MSRLSSALLSEMSRLLLLILWKSSDHFSPPPFSGSFVQFSQMSCRSSTPSERLQNKPLANIHSCENLPPDTSSPFLTPHSEFTGCIFSNPREQLKTSSRLPSSHSKLSESCLVWFLSKSQRASATWPRKIPFTPGSTLVQPTILHTVQGCPDQCPSDSSFWHFYKG